MNVEQMEEDRLLASSPEELSIDEKFLLQSSDEEFNKSVEISGCMNCIFIMPEKREKSKEQKSLSTVTQVVTQQPPNKQAKHDEFKAYKVNLGRFGNYFSLALLLFRL